MIKRQLLLHRLVLLSTGQSRTSSQAGLTLLECLVAMVIISVIAVAITPPIFLITATRVQNRRAEQATQLAQAEIDRIRTVVERGGYTTFDLPTDVVANIANVGPPTLASLRPVDTDGDGQPDFQIQSFRTTGLGGSATLPPNAFQMGVRVYSNSVDLTQLAPNQNQTSIKLTSGLGSQVSRPLAILYSTIVRNDAQDGLTNYRTLCPTRDSC